MNTVCHETGVALGPSGHHRCHGPQLPSSSSMSPGRAHTVAGPDPVTSLSNAVLSTAWRVTRLRRAVGRDVCFGAG
jgi:hypothetical protein